MTRPVDEIMFDMRISELNRMLVDVMEAYTKPMNAVEAIRLSVTATMALAITVSHHAGEIIDETLVEQCRKDAERIASRVLSRR